MEQVRTASVAQPQQHAWTLLGNRNFVLLWCAYGISAVGDHLSEMAILKKLGVLDAGVDVTPLNARMGFMFFVPFFILAPLAGVIADRLPRRLVMISADLVRCVILFGFGSLIALTSDWGSWGPFMPLLAVGMFAALFSPARSALLPTLIKPRELVRANGLIAGLGIIATMASALLGGMLAARYEPTVAFRVDAMTFVGSAVFLAFIRSPVQSSSIARRRPLSPVKDLLGGFRYALTHRRVLELLAVAGVVWFCGSLVNSVIPAVVRDVYHGGYQSMSGYRAFLGLGFIVGATIVVILGDALRSEIAITWGFFGIGASVAVFAASVFLPFSPEVLFIICAVGVVGAGVFGITVMASFNSLLQRIVPDRYRGRVFGVKDVVGTGALLTATGLLGVPRWANVDRWVGYILIAVAIMTFAAGFVTIMVRLRRSAAAKPLTMAQNLNELLARFWWHLQRIGPSTVPREGAVIVTANHTCSADPLFLSAVVRYRPLSFMVAAEFTKWPIAGSLMRMVDCIPVRRAVHDTGATKQAMRHLKGGKALGIFIEGRIVPPGEKPRPKDGVAMLALKTGTPVIPAYISGVAYRDGILGGLLTRHHARVRFGPPVDLSEFTGGDGGRESLRAATRKIYAAIMAMAPPGEAREAAESDEQENDTTEATS